MGDTEQRQLQHKKLILDVQFQLAHPATWQKGPRPREVRLIVLHSAECGESSGAAEALAQWAQGSGHPKGASWHFAVDSNSITQSVEIDDIAWHAGAVNGFSVGVEQAGRAAQTAAQWADDFSKAMLERTSQLLAVLTGMYDIPLDHVLDPSRPDVRGVCTHADVSKGYHVKGGHWDPGPNYPLDAVLEKARAYQLEVVS